MEDCSGPKSRAIISKSASSDYDEIYTNDDVSSFLYALNEIVNPDEYGKLTKNFKMKDKEFKEHDGLKAIIKYSRFAKKAKRILEINQSEQEKLPKSDNNNKENSSTVCDQFEDNGSPTTKVGEMQDAEFVCYMKVGHNGEVSNFEMKKVGEIDGSGSDAEFVKKLECVDTLTRDLKVSNAGKVGEIDGSDSDDNYESASDDNYKSDKDDEVINQEYLDYIRDLEDFEDDPEVPFKIDKDGKVIETKDSNVEDKYGKLSEPIKNWIQFFEQQKFISRDRILLGIIGKHEFYLRIIPYTACASLIASMCLPSENGTETFLISEPPAEEKLHWKLSYQDSRYFRSKEALIRHVVKLYAKIVEINRHLDSKKA